jgi:hypothetical protein
MSLENISNETVKYTVAVLRRIELELVKSQSAKLAMGFLGFDRDRTIVQMEAIKAMMLASDPVDLPETHPDSLLELKD